MTSRTRSAHSRLPGGGYNVINMPPAIYDSCDVNLCSTECWNNVAVDVREAVHLECGGGNCREVIVVGDDHIVPFLRIPDITDIGNEIGFNDSALPPSPMGAAVHGGFYLTDQHLCDFDQSISYGGGMLHLPDVPCRRVIESVVDMQNAFATATNLGSPMSLHTSGYEFLADGAQAIADIGTGQSYAVDPLIGQWDSDDAICHALGVGEDPEECFVRDLVSFQGHMNPWLWESEAGFRCRTTGDCDDGITVPDFVASSEFASADSILGWTIGCHSGFNIPDFFGPDCDGEVSCPEPFGGPDMAQAIAAAGGTARLMTGFGLGETDGIAGNELMDVLLMQAIADGASDIGVADVISREEYVLARSHLDEYDAKIVEQAQLYGLGGRGDVMSVASVAPALAGVTATPLQGTFFTTSTIIVDGDSNELDLDLIETGAGDYLTFDGDSRASGPRFRARGPIFELPLAGEVHDCVVIGGQTEDFPNWDFVNRGVDFEWNLVSTEPSNQNNGFSPATLCWVNTLGGSMRQRAFAAVAQANATGGVLRVWRTLKLETLAPGESCPDPTDTLDPQFFNLTAEAQGGDVTFRFDAFDSSGIARAIVLNGVGNTFVANDFDPLVPESGNTYAVVVPNAEGNELKLQVIDNCGNAIAVTAKSQALRTFQVRAQAGSYFVGSSTTLSCKIDGTDWVTLDEPIVGFDFGDGSVGGGPAGGPEVAVDGTDPVTVSTTHVYGVLTPDPVEFRCTVTDNNGANASGSALLVSACGDALEFPESPNGDWAACSIERTGFDFTGLAFVAGQISNKFSYRMKVTGCGLAKSGGNRVSGPATITEVGSNGLRFDLDLNECNWDGTSPITVDWDIQAGEKNKKTRGHRDQMPDAGGFPIP